MATLPYLGQVPAQWFNLSGSAALAGGVLYFYEVGTSTPKQVFADYQGNTSAGTSVTLDSTGRANVFTNGLYRVILRASAGGSQIGPAVDGIGFPAGVDAGAVGAVETYDDLRALTGADGAAFVVEGRAANGDGGAGLFVWDALDTSADDGGALLTPTSNPASGRWVRIFSGDMDLRWWGAVMDNATDDTAAYASALAASVLRERWLGIFGGTARLASTVSAPSGSMVRFSRGGALTASSGTVSAGFPNGSTLEGAYQCFKGSLVVSIAQEAAWQIDPDWWDSVDDDTRILAACDACASANQQVLIRHAYAMTTDFTQPSNAVLVFEGSGKLAWSGAGAVDLILRRFTSGDPTGGRFTFSSAAKLASLTMVESQGVYLSPRLFGGVGSGDESAAIWPALLHGWVEVDDVYRMDSALTKTGDVFLRGDLVNPQGIATSGDIPHGIQLGAGVVLTVSGDMAVNGTGVFGIAGSGVAELLVGGTLSMESGYLWGADIAGVSSFGAQAAPASISNCKLALAPIHAPNSTIRDSEVSGSSTYDVSGADVIGLGGAGWTIDRTEIAENSAIGIVAIRNSSIIAEAIAWPDGAECINSTVAPRDVTSMGEALGAIVFVGGRVTMPLVADEASVIQVTGVSGPLATPAFGYTEMPWNGLGIMDVSGTPGAAGTLSDPRHAMRPCARSVDGITAPRYSSSALAAEAISTSATTGWTFAPSATPSIVDDAFVWAAGDLSASPAAISRAITSTEERILAAYGGIVLVDFSGGIEAVRLLIGDEDISLLKCPGATTQRMAYHVWPGTTAASAPTLGFQLSHDGTEGSLKVTVIPCAPLDSRQWVEFWGGDRTLSATTYNSWKETLDEDGDCVSLSVWCDTLPASPYTPRPETIQPALYDFAPEVRIFPKTLGTAATNPFMSAKAPSAVNFYSYLSTRG